MLNTTKKLKRTNKKDFLYMISFHGKRLHIGKNYFPKQQQNWNRCTFWFNVGSRIIEKIRGAIFSYF